MEGSENNRTTVRLQQTHRCSGLFAIVCFFLAVYLSGEARFIQFHFHLPPPLGLRHRRPIRVKSRCRRRHCPRCSGYSVILTILTVQWQRQLPGHLSFSLCNYKFEWIGHRSNRLSTILSPPYAKCTKISVISADLDQIYIIKKKWMGQKVQRMRFCDIAKVSSIANGPRREHKTTEPSFLQSTNVKKSNLEAPNSDICDKESFDRENWWTRKKILHVTFDWALLSASNGWPTDWLILSRLGSSFISTNLITAWSRIPDWRAVRFSIEFLVTDGRKAVTYNPHHLRLLWSGSVLDGDKSECSIHGSVRS